MTGANAMLHEEALGWVIRTRDPDFVEWDAFTIWLEADPAHAAAYDAVMAADAGLAAIISAPGAKPAPANDPGMPGSRPRRWIAGGAIAAAVVAAISIGNWTRSDIYTVTTRPGEVRNIVLDDGTRIDLNGGSTLRLDHKNDRFAALDGGEPSFSFSSHPSPCRTAERPMSGAAAAKKRGRFLSSRIVPVNRVPPAAGVVSSFTPSDRAMSALICATGMLS